MSVGFLLENTASKHPNRTAIVSDTGEISYGELHQRVRALAAGFRGRGLQTGDRIAILAQNGSFFVETYFAAMEAGLVVVPVNFRFSGGEIVYVLNHSQVKALCYEEHYAETVGRVYDQLDTVRLLVSSSNRPGLDAAAFENLLAEGRGGGSLRAVSPSAPCQLMYTSGTTGKPKGALITHQNVTWNLMNTLLARGDTPHQIALIVGPLYHTASLNNHLTIQIALGGTAVLIRKFEPEALLQTLARTKATVISGSPAMYNLLMGHPAAGGYDTRTITKCTAGADKLPVETKRRLREFFPGVSGVYDVYGCTEASPTITVLHERDSMRKDGSVGRAVAFLDVRIVDPSGNPLPSGAVGELTCRGPNVMTGYHRDPQASQEAIRDGWLHPGDLATADEEGFIYIVDRKKDMVVSGGENIYPREIEEVLYAHPDIADAAVVGVADELWGERVRAFVVTRPGRSLTAVQIIDHCKTHLASYKKPREVVFLDSIPRNPSGKALKRELRRFEPAGIAKC